MTPVQLLMITPNFDNNSLGRTYCLWLLARELGWSVRVLGVRGSVVWEPLRETPFAADCLLLADLEPGEQTKALRECAGWSHVVLAVKPLPTSLGLAAELVAAVPRPLMVDIDDPDLEYRLSWQPLRRRLRDRVGSDRRRELVRLRGLTRTVPVFVSNPVLQDWYGGVVVPHARPEAPIPSYRSAGPMVVRFVGSPRGHKGLDVLRSSVERLRGLDPGFDLRLEVTADAPEDATPWESWLGQTTFEAGQALVASADVVALPSLEESWSHAQLPAKLMDAMMMGRAVVASDLAPIRWAMAGTGILVPPGDVLALAEALRALCDPQYRQELGTAAYAHALAAFGVRALAPVFAAHVRAAIGAGTTSSEAGSMTSEQLTGRALVVAVLTYRRPAELASLLPELARQAAGCSAVTGLTASILVVDNDPARSGAQVAAGGGWPESRVRYVAEGTPGIAAARNRALSEAESADLMVFIDDDEWPQEGWLAALVHTYARLSPAGVVGPVVSEFAVPPGRWVAAGRFFDRRRLVTGTEVRIAASNNLLLDLHQVAKWGLAFDERFGLSGGSDTLFTHQLITHGGRLVWCAEAMVVDQVPASRLTPRWVLQRAMRSGNSWSRTLLADPLSPRERVRRRAMLTGRGGVRLVGGFAQFLSGLAVWSLSRQARGLRTAARGLGMFMGAHGIVYSEYRRRGQRSSGRAKT